MILKLLLNILGTIISILINIITSISPTTDLHNSLSDIITMILSTTQQALNFMYLIFGETLYIVLPSILALLGFKYLIYPTVTIIRSFFINSNE